MTENRRPAERNIVLIGMPASGKSTIGYLVAQKLGRTFYDSDAEIEAAEGRTCAQIINERGEAEFRKIERAVITRLMENRAAVISVGGGAPMTCADILRQNSVVVYLNRALNDISATIGDASRPLSRSREDLERLYAQRHDTYQTLAHVTVDNNSARDTVAARIAEAVAPHLKARLLVINGPNLNLLGIREPSVYGSETFENLLSQIRTGAAERNIAADCFQSNHEGAIIDALHGAMCVYDGIAINPGAYTHYSYAIFDALKAIALPAVEVHISDISAREEFRRISVTAPACIEQISGEGFPGYIRAMDKLLEVIV